ncbi:MAG TPA: hypothetical protein VEJ40_05090 [Pseudolabrys sp.]|jgi:hypothetical protein|nr:hypothetical protein [Pseudolabrys sp.]
MRTLILSAAVAAALAAPALADNYPVSGDWGQSSSSAKGAIDCAGKRVIGFSGNQRTDSNGGVPAYRNKSVTVAGSGTYRIEDIFTTGQISKGYARYTLRQVDDDHIVMQMQNTTLKLQRCK